MLLLGQIGGYLWGERKRNLNETQTNRFIDIYFKIKI